MWTNDHQVRSAEWIDGACHIDVEVGCSRQHVQVRCLDCVTAARRVTVCVETVKGSQHDVISTQL